MRVAALTADHRFEVVTVDDPTPGPDELVVAVGACGICGSDLKSYSAMPAGSVLGHEFCGRVVAVGTRARETWREGQFVAAMPVRACGRCRWCLADEPAHCERVDLLGVGGSAGAFADLVRVDANLTVALPESVGDLGAAVEPLAVGLHAAATAGIRPGDRVLILGGGSVGSAVTIWARRLGAVEVVVSDPAAARRDGAAAFGATGTHDPADGAPPSGFDVVVECVGAPNLIQTALGASAVRGRVVVVGVCMQPDPIIPVTALLKELEVRFAVYYRRGEFRAAADLVASGQLDPEVLGATAVGLDGLDAAFSRLLAGDAGRKVIVKPSTPTSSTRSWRP